MLARVLVASLLLSLGTSCARTAPTATTTTPAAPAEPTWRDWSPASFAEAKDHKKIILVDVIARWCHWCHVMDEETYADPEVAALLAEHFVVIRVDSDARPDVAERYADWGWPATAVLTSDARPVLELRGFQDPREFAALLRQLVADHQAGKLTGRRPTPPPPVRGGDLSDLRLAAQKQLDGTWDSNQSGWGRKQKYPLAANNEYALLRAHLYQEPDWQERALTVLGRQRALIDPVWGGMYQYSVHAVWTDPHFEKIGAIQAGALDSYGLALRRTRDARWQQPARDVLRYLLEFMQAEDGGFYTSQDADLRKPTGRKEPVLGDEYYALGDKERRALGIPTIDTGINADLNGMLIRGLCQYYGASADEPALTAALKAGEQLLKTHGDADGSFRHRPDDQGPLRHLRDQSAMGRGLLALFRVTGDIRWLERARAVADFSLAQLQDPSGGFFAHTADPSAVGVFAERRKPFEENAQIARFLIELHHNLDHDRDDLPYLPAAERAIRAISDPKLVAEQGRQLGEYLGALAELTATPIDVTVVGRPGDAAARALLRAALAYDEPRATVAMSPPGARYPDQGKPAAYLCTDTACSTPITDPAKFQASADGFLRNIPRP